MSKIFKDTYTLTSSY